MPTMTLDDITARALATIPAYHVTSTAAGGERLETTGLVIYWDESDPTTAGWAYRRAQCLDLGTMEWDGEESGPLDTLAELDALLAEAAERSVALA